MYEKMEEQINNIPNGVKTDWGEIVWPLETVPVVLDLVLNNKWVVLGGDILTAECKHTYDNWYFNPNPIRPLHDNVKVSVEKCSQYISDYADKYGTNFLVALSISNTYIGGKS